MRGSSTVVCFYLIKKFNLLIKIFLKEHACHALHRTLAQAFRYAIVWGTSTKFSPQRVGIQHKLHHEDVIQIVKKN